MNQIKKEHILAAIAEIDKKGVQPGRHSSTYDLVYEGKSYPPKLVTSIANRFATGVELKSEDFHGGLNTPAFDMLIREGFKIVPKKDNFKALIENYKVLIKETHLKDEHYKWQLLAEYKGRPNLSVQDLLQEVKSIKYGNLIYNLGIAVMHHLLREKPEDVRVLFKNLFDENIALTKRVNDFNEGTLKVYRELDQRQQHHQDERTISTYLTFYNPEKYTFYKYSFYKKLCELLEVKQAGKNEKYTHYLDLVNQIIDDYIKNDVELIDLVKEYIPEYDSSNHLLLAQDILYQMLDKNGKKQYWLYSPGEYANRWEDFYERGIFAIGWDKLGDLKQYKSRAEIKTALLQAYGGEGDKKNDVSANDDFANKINIGDVIIVKRGRSELLGYGEVTSDYYFSENDVDYKSRRDIEWKLKGNWSVDFSLVLKTLTDITKYTSDLPQFTKYSEELIAIMTVSKTNYKEAFSKYLDSIYGTTSGTKSSYIKALDVLSSIITSNIFEENNIQKLQELYEDLIKHQQDTEGKYFHSDAPSYGQNGFYSAATKRYIDFHKSFSSKPMEQSNYKAPLNQILYGPPGTGKTYNTVLEAAKIVLGHNDISYDEALKVFNDNLGNQIEFITFHQNYSYEDFIQGLRPDTENGSNLTFEKKDGVFKRIADRALKNLEASKNPAIVKKDFDVVFSELIKPLNDGDVNEVEIKMKKSSFFITEIGEKSIEFRKSIGDSEHTLSINTLRKMYEKGTNDIILGGLQPYYNPILDLLLEKGKNQITSVDKKNYVIIIDEINRANISRVFGELITLIEDDKRSHGKIPMQVTLPSGDSFIVPSNLYIIGTMNTADKSIALLDIALRRRFEFVPKYPDVTLESVYDKEILSAINTAILDRKNHDFTIGHAYFMGDDYSREKTINNKVLPLLLEYFMNDEKEVVTILKSAGIEMEGWPLKMKV